MQLRKGFALILALALSMSTSWCLADAEDDIPVWDANETVETGDIDSGEDENMENEAEFPLSIPFPDVSASSDYAQAVAYLATEGIFTGDPLGNFNPDAKITRAEVAAIICRLMREGDAASNISRQLYHDVDSTNWAAGYIAKATELGVFNGDGTGNFRPTDNVTYEQIIKILVCACGYESKAQRNGGWPNGYISVAADLGITNGVRFSQTADAPRSAVAQFLYNAIQQ